VRYRVDCFPCSEVGEFPSTAWHFNPFSGSRPRSPAQTHTRAFLSKTNNINFKNASLHIKLITERGPKKEETEQTRPVCLPVWSVWQPLKIVFFCRARKLLHKRRVKLLWLHGEGVTIWGGREDEATADSQQLMHSENWRHNLCLQSGLFKENLEHFSPEQQHQQQPEHVLSSSSSPSPIPFSSSVRSCQHWEQ